MEELLKQFASHGVVGLFLAWQLWKNREDAKSHREEMASAWAEVSKSRASVERLTLAELIRLTLSPHLSEDMKTQLREMVHRMESESKLPA